MVVNVIKNKQGFNSKGYPSVALKSINGAWAQSICEQMQRKLMKGYPRVRTITYLIFSSMTILDGFLRVIALSWEGTLFLNSSGSVSLVYYSLFVLEGMQSK